MGNTQERNAVLILCAVFFCAVLFMIPAAGAATSASLTISGVYKGAPPIADFTWSPTSPIATHYVTFTDKSTRSPTSWAWDFDNDGTVDSTKQNPPTVIFSNAGTYTANLTVSNAAGLTDTTLKTITVTAPLTAFTATQTTCSCPWKVTFNDISTGRYTSREWAYQKVGTTAWTPFGSGLPTETFSFSTSAAYNIRLNVTTNVVGYSDSLIKTITPGTLTARFTASTTSGPAPLTVKFTDTSIGIPTSWTWDFGDKTPYSTEKNPVHKYAKAGKYTVKLTCKNECNIASTNSASVTVK